MPWPWPWSPAPPLHSPSPISPPTHFSTSPFPPTVPRQPRRPTITTRFEHDRTDKRGNGSAPLWRGGTDKNLIRNAAPRPANASIAPKRLNLIIMITPHAATIACLVLMFQLHEDKTATPSSTLHLNCPQPCLFAHPAQARTSATMVPHRIDTGHQNWYQTTSPSQRTRQTHMNR